MIDGQDITEIYSLKSWHDNNTIRVIVGDKEYRMPTYVILQMVNEFNFKTEFKRKYAWIVEATLK